MDLWTEFEGVTIDSAYSLNKLLQTEGRSAFFSTLNANGESVLIRIVECHFDEEEIQARWRGVQTLGDPNFLGIDRFGQFLIEEDGITAVYAVFERVDANLGQVLERGRLSTADAVQIGLSMASALETLHAHGFVHQHVEAANIYAVGEAVKLRGDCVRETPEGEAGLIARRRDVHDLAVVLQQVLAGAPRYAQASRQALPAPFEEIVRNGMTGEWGLAEIQSALAAQRGTKGTRAATQTLVGGTARERAAKADAPGVSAKPGQNEAAARGETEALKERAGTRIEAGIGRSTAAISNAAERPVFTREPRAFGEESNWKSFFEDPVRRWVVAGALLAVILLLGWFLTRGFFGGHEAARSQAASAAETPAAPSPKTTAPRAASSQTASAAHPASQDGVQWRVVAYTYNHKDQAQKKVSSLSQKYGALKPEVFSPNGRTPWLVTVGGAMQRDAAYALARKARTMGLPRDTYAQNYTAR